MSAAVVLDAMQHAPDLLGWQSVAAWGAGFALLAGQAAWLLCLEVRDLLALRRLRADRAGQGRGWC